MCGFCVSKEIINMEHYEGKIVGTKKVDILCEPVYHAGIEACL